MVQKVKIVLAIVSLLFLAQVASCQPQTGVFTKLATIKKSQRLVIPTINVDANVQSVGINSNGEMGVPNNIVDVAWFKLGPKPGEVGSAVIAGHLNGKNGEKGVFANLDKLKRGDLIYISSLIFVVSQSKVYSSGYADDVFSRSDGTYLNLITCNGQWDKSKKDYNKRLVVSAVLVLDK